MVKLSLQTFYKNPAWSDQTSIELDHVQSIIDLRRRQIHEQSHARLGKKLDSRIVINVSGVRFETFRSTLERYPNTLLGNIHRRSLFYDNQRKEYFFDRHRLCFEAILYYYQSRGRLRRPENVPLDTFLEEITFFQLGYDALMQVRDDENLEEVKKRPLPSNHFYRHLWANLEYPQYSMIAKIIHICSAAFILLSAVMIAVETLPDNPKKNDNSCHQQSVALNYSRNPWSHFPDLINFRSPFFIIESICIALFTVEFILRLISCPSFLTFIKSILNWIDFLAILPYYIILIINYLGCERKFSKTYVPLLILLILRCMRVFKLYRILQHIKSFRVLVSTLKESIPDFFILLSFLTLSSFIYGSAIYFAENQCDIHSIPAATYYGIITLTGVGYGDLAPKTAIGRALASFAAMYGVTIVSILVSVLVGRYQRVYNRKRFFNSDYSEKLMFQTSVMQSKNHDECLGMPMDIGNAFSPVPDGDDDNSMENDQQSEKVHFIINDASEEDDDNK